MSLWQSLLAAWREDRIRTSPRDGALLRLREGSCLAINGRPAVVVDRWQAESESGVRVHYTCDCGTGCGELCVGPVTLHEPLRVTWQQELVDAGTIAIYGQPTIGPR